MVKHNKYTLENLETNIKTDYKTLRQIATDLKLEPYVCTNIFKHSYEPRTYQHRIMGLLCAKYKITAIVP